MTPARILLPALFSLWSFAPSQAERIALIIGNDSYSHLPRLVNAGRDAELVAAALINCGFKVNTHLDADQKTFLDALSAFKLKAKKAEAAVVYFAGHGLEVAQENYLLPIHANPETEDQLRNQSLPLKQLLADLADTEATIKIAILDCCREGFSVRTRGLNPTNLRSRGLAAISSDGFAPGTAVLFAAAPGQLAADEDPTNARHGPFALALGRALELPGASAREVFDRVAEDVFTVTQQRQDPWLRYDGPGRAFRNFLFRPALATAGPARPPSAPSSSAGGNRQKELLDLEDAEVGQPYLSPIGAPIFCGMVLRNVSRQPIEYQVQSSTGWRTQTLAPGAEKFIADDFGCPLRLRQEGRFRKVTRTMFAQPYILRTQINLDRVRQGAATAKVLLNVDAKGEAYVE
jgi:uncharacterized caspase-like protein